MATLRNTLVQERPSKTSAISRKLLGSVGLMLKYPILHLNSSNLHLCLRMQPFQSLMLQGCRGEDSGSSFSRVKDPY